MNITETTSMQCQCCGSKNFSDFEPAKVEQVKLLSPKRRKILIRVVLIYLIIAIIGSFFNSAFIAMFVPLIGLILEGGIGVYFYKKYTKKALESKKEAICLDCGLALTSFINPYTKEQIINCGFTTYFEKEKKAFLCMAETNTALEEVVEQHQKNVKNLNFAFYNWHHRYEAGVQEAKEKGTSGVGVTGGMMTALSGGVVWVMDKLGINAKIAKKAVDKALEKAQNEYDFSEEHIAVIRDSYREPFFASDTTLTGIKINHDGLKWAYIRYRYTLNWINKNFRQQADPELIKAIDRSDDEANKVLDEARDIMLKGIASVALKSLATSAVGYVKIVIGVTFLTICVAGAVSRTSSGWGQDLYINTNTGEIVNKGNILS